MTHTRGTRLQLTVASGRCSAGGNRVLAPGSGCGGEVAAVDGSGLGRRAGGLQGPAGPSDTSPADLARSGVELPVLLRVGLAGGDYLYKNQLIGHVHIMARGCDILSRGAVVSYPDDVSRVGRRMSDSGHLHL